ncbi:hypothetical protein NFI96_014478 [Prochilodus magdalenae]|nr:hypothetical protein NFI96_014478 [Prochilodus magdalenae]
MDALKSAGRAIIRSPSLAKQSWTSGKHKMLPGVPPSPVMTLANDAGQSETYIVSESQKDPAKPAEIDLAVGEELKCTEHFRRCVCLLYGKTAGAVKQGLFKIKRIMLVERLIILSLSPELPENWTDTRETLLEGMVFQLKYLGVTLVEQPKGEELSAAAVKRIVATAKASGKKLQKVTLKVSPRGIILHDSASNQLIENISIYRISYCTADKMHDKVFAYIAQSQHNETLECHAFLCTKKKVAQAVTLTVAQAFRVAFEFWQAAKEEKEKRVKSGSDGVVASNSHPENLDSLKEGEVATGNLLNLEEGAIMAMVHSGREDTHADTAQSISTENNNTVWELDDGLDEAFSRLAECRANPQVLDIGLNPQDYNAEECLSPGNWDKADAEAADAEDTFGI